MKRLLSVVAVACVLTLAWPVAGQSLGEIAKKNAEAKAKKAGDTKPEAQPAAAKTYTNKDLADIKVPDTKVEPTTPVDPTPVRDPLPVTLTKVQPEENEWRGKMRTLETQITGDALQLEAARRRLVDADNAWHRNGYTLASRILEAEVLAARNDVNRWRATVAADQAQIAQFEEDARKAGVPPGWLR